MTDTQLETAAQQRSDGMPVGTPFKPGQSGNPNGRPEGRRSLSTIIRDVLEEEIDWDLLPAKQAEQMQERFKDKRGWEALVYVAVEKAIEGDAQAREWLRKAGYGDKIDVTSDNKPLPILAAIINVPGNDSSTKDIQGQQESPGDSGRDGSGEDDSHPALPDKPSADKE